MKFRLGLIAMGWVAVGCFADPPGVGAETGGESTGSSGDPSTGSGSPVTSATNTTTEPTTGSPPTSGSSESSAEDSGSTGESLPGCVDGPCLVDVVVVVDNSGTMAEEQRQIGVAMVALEAGLREGGYDAHVMFTTTDFGNPQCTPFQPDGYTPAAGSPIATSCTDRLDDFTALTGLSMVPEACTDTCPAGLAPVGDPFVAFGPDGDNVPNAPDIDIDGDGTADPPAARALACLAPQGIVGCGYESQLEAIIAALNPGAPWNMADNPFLRAGSTVAVVLVTDEADCSIQDYGFMDDPMYQEINPFTGTPGTTSAVCWNAGVQCSGGPEVYDDCVSATPTPLHELSRYTDFLADGLGDREVVMLGLVGVPSVTEHLDAPPFTPVQGGVLDVEYRAWIDGEYPVGDILPQEWAMGVTAAEKHYNFGIGPGCTGGNEVDGFTGQAIPPVREREVCESLDVGTDPADLRCCLESVCDADYTGATRCLLGLLGNVN